MDYTLQNAYNQLASSNTLYTNYKARWQFLLESYQGGEEYRTGKHLTMYKTETTAEYAQRLATTPLDNHCRSVISVYTSFLFREEPDREFNSLDGNLNLLPFLDDADLDGRSLDAFMKDVAIWSSVFGHCWIIVAKPQTNAATRAGELEQGVRPYVNVLTPLVVTDWTWERQPSGAYELSYIKYLEEVNDTFSTVKEWTREAITTSQLNNEKQLVEYQTVEVNQLGKIPAVCVYASRSPVRGIGSSLITDIADYQRQIYNLNSEVEQSIRLSGHPTLVKTADVEASAGAGSIALMPDNLDPGLKPYLLNVATDINQIYQAINTSVEAIDKMANTGAVRAVQSTAMSGVAMETEFQLLNAKLSEFADALELAEEQMWRLWALYEGTVWDGEIEYPGAFNIRDTANEYKSLQIASQSATTPNAKAVVDYRLRELLDDPRCDYDMEEEADEAVEYQFEIDKLNEIAGEINAMTTTAPPTEATPPPVNFDQTSCPIATQDVAVNLANRQTAIDTANYGPLNPAQPNTIFWARLADKWSVSEEMAKQSRCGNCAAFNQTSQIKECINAGLSAGGATGDEYDTIAAGDLGYCEAFDFKCASSRTCDAWVIGGPITD